jgi:hypothetical protein
MTPETGIQCSTEGCAAPVEASVPLWLNVDANGAWSIYGVGDEVAQVLCQEGHDNWTRELGSGLSAFIADLLPDTTWERGGPALKS